VYASEQFGPAIFPETDGNRRKIFKPRRFFQKFPGWHGNCM
jgi:hypothetical protein